MKFRIFSIFAGIGQAIVLFIFLGILLNLLGPWTYEWMLTDKNGFLIVILLMACGVILLPYPIFLLRRNQRWDAIITLMVSIVVFVGFSLFITQQMFGGID